MIDEPGRVRRLLVLAAAAVALVAVSGGSVVLAGNNGTKPNSSDVAATTAPVAATTTSTTALKEAADAAVQALVEDRTINQHQADVLRQQIDAGYMDEQKLVDGGVLTAAQMQAVLNRLLAVKESFASGAGSTAPSASKISKDPSTTK